MTFKSSAEIRQHIFTEVRKKVGNVHIHLAVTQNGRARLSIGTHINVKDFVTQRDALQWLIHSYNLKHLKNILSSCPHQAIRENREGNKRTILSECVDGIVDKIAAQEYYTHELFRSIESMFDHYKLEKNLSDDEVGHIYAMVTEALKKLLDKTLDHRRYEVYKQYSDQLRIKFYRKY